MGLGEVKPGTRRVPAWGAGLDLEWRGLAVVHPGWNPGLMGWLALNRAVAGVAGDVLVSCFDLGLGEAVALVVAGGPDSAAVDGLAYPSFEAGGGGGDRVVAMMHEDVGVPGFDGDGDDSVVELGAGVLEGVESGVLVRGG